MTNRKDAEARAREVAHAAIVKEHGPERYADQARDGNWPIFRVAVEAARQAASEVQREAIERAAKECDDVALAAHEGNSPLVEATAETLATAIRSIGDPVKGEGL